MKYAQYGTVARFPVEMSRYTMIVHRPEVESSTVHAVLAQNRRSAAPEGLSTARALCRRRALVPHRLFTLIGVAT